MSFPGDMESNAHIEEWGRGWGDMGEREERLSGTALKGRWSSALCYTPVG